MDILSKFKQIILKEAKIRYKNFSMKIPKKSQKYIDKHVKNIIYYDSIGVLSDDRVKLK